MQIMRSIDKADCTYIIDDISQILTSCQVDCVRQQTNGDAFKISLQLEKLMREANDLETMYRLIL